MGIIISDKDKLIQDLGKRVTKVTDVYSTTHVVVHWGDVQEIVEKFFMDKNSDWLMAKTEPNNSEKPNNCEPQMAEDIVRSFGFNVESYRQAKAKDEPQTDCTWK